MKQYTKIKIIIVSIIIIILLMIILNIKNIQWDDKKIENLTFTSADWKKTKKYERYKYLESMNLQYELIGMTSEEIITLLGEPDKNNDTGDERYTYMYLVKKDDWMGPLYYEINFEDNIVYKHKIVEDNW